MRQAEVRQADGREEQELDRRLDGVGLEAEGRCAGRAAAVVDEDVDPAEGLERPLHDALEVARIRQVAAHGEGADPLGLALEHVAAAGEHRHMRAFFGERFGDREPHPGRRAADDRRPVAQA